MNKIFSLDDTFDNLSFSDSGRFLNRNNNFNEQLDGNEAVFLETSLNNKAVVNTKLRSCDSFQIYNNKTVRPVGVIIHNISVDDSIFLNDESFSLCENGIDRDENEQSRSTKNSNKLLCNTSEERCNRSGYAQSDYNEKLPIEKIVLDTRENVTQNEAPTKSVQYICTGSSLSENCALSAWGLPDPVLQKYKNRGITHMFRWQAECLGNLNLMANNANLVYSAPTSAGKTLVAEILVIKTVLERQKKVLFILPFISVVREKMFYFQDILGSSGIRVEGFMGSHSPPGGFQTVQVAVCTIEKANGIINRLLEEGTLSDVGAVVVDEMHLLGDSGRGYLLELMLTKLQYMTIRYENTRIQIIGMSATLPNLDLLGKWLKAELYTTDFRPIPLYEQCLVCGEIYNKNLKLKRCLLNLPELETDTDNILQLCLETIQNSCSVLIFCPTKNWCENLAQQIATAFWKLGCSKTPFGLVLRKELRCDSISELLEQLKRCPVGLDKILQKTASYGVAFHHAGLTMDERDIIECAFRSGALRVLVATSTLSSGVNLPARRVIIRTPIFHGKPIDNLMYRQMIGRAGRMGRDSCGESILICQKNNYRIAKELLSAELQPIESCLGGARKLERAILEVIASGVAATPDDVQLFTRCTLFAVSEGESADVLRSPVNEAIEFLNKNEFIRLQKLENGSSKYIATSLGKACLSASMPPEEGLALFSELEKARQCFVLETELHLIYLVTPYSVCNQWGDLDWMLFLELWEKLPPSMKRVGELVGIRESYIVNGTRKKLPTNTSKLYQKLQIHRRFFTALALQDLVDEVPLNDVAAKFGCSRGMLQSLQQSASTFAGMLTIFSRHLGWSSVEILISQFQDRLQFGVSRDLLDLMRLPILNGPRARALYNAGVETLVHLASSDICTIENVLHKVAPFESEKEREGESEFDTNKRNKIRSIWVTGKEGLTERAAATMLVQDARRYLQLELGLAEAKWEETKEEECDENILQESLKSTREVQEVMNSSLENCYKSQEESKVETVTETTKNIEEYVGNNSKHKEVNLSVSPELKYYLEFNTSPASRCNNSIKEEANLKLERKGGDNILSISDQSLFEDSFELNRQLANCAISNDFHNNDDYSSSTGHSGDSGLDFDNGSFLENAFVSSFNLEPEVSQDKILEEFPIEQHNNSELIGNSQPDLIDVIVSNKDFSTLSSTKLFSRMCRKRERTDEENIYKSSIADEDELLLYTEHTPTKRRRTQTVKGTKEHLCSVSQDNTEDSTCVSFTKLEIVDVCNDEKVYKAFCTELFKEKIISLSFACSKVSENKPTIGNNIIRKTIVEKIQNEVVSDCPFIYKDCQVVGVAITWGGNVAYYISFENVTIIPNRVKINTLKNVLTCKMLTVRMFDCKEQVKVAKLCCGLDFYCDAEDSKVADWLIEPESKEKNLQAMAVTYAKEAVNLSQLIGNCKGVGSAGLNLNSTTEPQIRAAVEAVVSWNLCVSVRDVLIKQNVQLLATYKIEMSSILCLARMELNGLRVDVIELQALADNLKYRAGELEKRAHTLAGRHFSFASSTEVAKVLGIYRGHKVSIQKQTLKQQGSPIASVILQWRKLNCTLTKMVYPLIRLVQNDRIHGCCVTFNSTGRISMHEPNLQNIPRDFNIEDYVTNSKVCISCRTAFVPGDNCVFLSGDYCQLELRLLAHLSRDPLLCSIMESGEDVFKTVAAKWKNIQETQVDDVLRQWAKQLCYGIIYGMGAKALAEQLSVTEDEAVTYMESFRDRYPNIKTYVRETISRCKNLGYVETFAGRRRYLPNILHHNAAVRSQAERQAVNTTVQGSAADTAKAAMVLIEERFRIKFRHPKNLPKLVLHLHDELLYQVQVKYLNKTATILKKSMEEAVKLSVPLPVKLKSGSTWGTMKELVL